MSATYSSLAHIFQIGFFKFDNLTFNTYTCTKGPQKYYGDNTCGSGQGFTYFPLDFDYGDRASILDGTTGEVLKMPDSMVGFPGTSLLRFTDGSSVPALVSGGSMTMTHSSDAPEVTLVEGGGLEYADEALEAGVGEMIEDEMFGAGPDTEARMEEEMRAKMGDLSIFFSNLSRFDGPPLSVAVKTGIKFATNYNFERYAINTGFMWGSMGPLADNTQARVRQKLLYAPSVERTGAGSEARPYESPLDGFYKNVTAAIIGPPPKDKFGFFDSQSDFVYAISNRMWGVVRPRPPARPDMQYLPMQSKAFRTPFSARYAKCHLQSPIEADLPCKAIVDEIISHQINPNRLAKKAYTTFYMSLRFGYNVKYLTYPDSHHSQAIANKHPNNDDGYGRGEYTSTSARFIAEVVNPAASEPVNDFQYTFTGAHGGRLRPCFYRAPQEEEVTTGGTTKTPTTDANAAGLYPVGVEITADYNETKHSKFITKTFYPRPFDGEEFSYRSSIYIPSFTAPALHDSTMNSAIVAERTGLTGDALEYLQAACTEHIVGLSNNEYIMKWGGAFSSAAEGERERQMKLSYGTQELTVSEAVFRMETMIKRLGSYWNLDTRPKTTQILRQPTEKIDKSAFSSITSTNEVQNFEVIQNVNPAEALNARLRSVGFNPNQSAVEAIIRQTGRDYGYKTTDIDMEGFGVGTGSDYNTFGLDEDRESILASAGTAEKFRHARPRGASIEDVY